MNMYAIQRLFCVQFLQGRYRFDNLEVVGTESIVLAPTSTHAVGSVVVLVLLSCWNVTMVKQAHVS